MKFIKVLAIAGGLVSTFLLVHGLIANRSWTEDARELASNVWQSGPSCGWSVGVADTRMSFDDLVHCRQVGVLTEELIEDDYYIQLYHCQIEGRLGEVSISVTRKRMEDWCGSGYLSNLNFAGATIVRVIDP